MLVQCALAASNPRSKKHPEILSKSQQLRKRRGAKKARVAIARRLLTAIFQMLMKDEPYSPYIAPPAPSIPHKRILTTNQALSLLRSKGFIIEDLPSSA